jgi:NAD(P)-dependent dehydrogenase (short-subunit alcohol dehydrogenase family)
MSFKNKVVLVTGSSRGIGLAIALKFAIDGAALIVHGPEDNDELKDAWQQVRQTSPDSIKVACNLADSQAIPDMFKEVEKKFNRLQVLINNAVYQKEASFLDIEEDDWDRVFAVNLKAPFLCAQGAVRMMIRQGGGKIINIGSVHESQARRGYLPYSTSKGGLLMLTKNLALELAGHNIQVNQVTPGAIATALTDPQRQQKFLTAVPAGRVGQPADIADMVYFLCSEQAGYVTGSSFVVDGGLTLGFCASRPDL